MEQHPCSKQCFEPAQYELICSIVQLSLVSFLYKASPQQGDLRLSGLPSGQGASGGARTLDRRVPADLRADSLATVPPTLPYGSVKLSNNTFLISTVYIGSYLFIILII
ncbi:hypothetical protein PoB_007625800 [Plakobranchus ocellatus]|uniref:Uncharacterized protein n=1 Tax=Plakobranchus ocellatus TaxID=259542 RepID=A0AAV4DZH8_9GAST|nr:hypothetical protein PoB_007625800 [Plakobranchus ocellatus]